MHCERHGSGASSVSKKGTPAKWALQVHPAAADELAALDERSYRRIRAALQRLEEEPYRARAGTDLKKRKELRDGAGLYRLRIGENRAVYAAIGTSREVFVLVVEKREVGYARLIATAEAR